MSSALSSSDLQTALDRLEAAAGQEKLSTGAVDNIRIWLTESRYAPYAASVAEHLAAEKWRELDDAFWTVIPFGTGGRRGRMYPIGSNAINERTIGESAQGLAEYVCSLNLDGPRSCAIAYDTRINSREFAELCAGIMAAHGFHVYFLDGHRSTPALSFLVRHRQCSCGIMVTASHNPPSDNAVKVYWSSGVQVRPPHDRAIIDSVMKVEQLKVTPFAEACDAGQVTLCGKDVDEAYVSAVIGCRQPGPRDLRIIYSPLHGVGATSVVPVLERDGFAEVEVYGPHAEPDGNFPNVPDHVSNPENPAVFDAMIERGKETAADLILATDPDADRMGCAAPLTTDSSGPWATLSGNQLAALLCDFVLDSRRNAGGLSADQYVVTTLVTTKMIRRIAESYGVGVHDNLLVGFKWICGLIDELDPNGFLYGTEESHGFAVGQYARDKDGAAACMLLAEMAAVCKSQGQTLHQKLEALFWQHGYHAERLLNVRMEGSQGMQDMRRLMSRLRSEPPTELGGISIAALRDHQSKTIRNLVDGSTQPLDGPEGDLVILELAEAGNYVAVRPSGTEPKVKMYMFTFTPAELLADLDLARDEMNARLDAAEQDLRSLAESCKTTE